MSFTDYHPLTAAMTPEERALGLPGFAVRVLCDSRLAWLDGDALLTDIGARPPSERHTVPGAWHDPDGLEPRIDTAGRVLRPPSERGQMLLLPLRLSGAGLSLEVVSRAVDDTRRAAAVLLRYLWEGRPPLSMTPEALRVMSGMHPRASEGRAADMAYTRRKFAASDVLAVHRLSQPGEFERLSAAVAAKRAGRPTRKHNLNGEDAPAWWADTLDLY